MDNKKGISCNFCWFGYYPMSTKFGCIMDAIVINNCTVQLRIQWQGVTDPFYI